MHLLTRLSLVNRLVVALVSIAIVIFGVIAVTSLKQELIPSTQPPQAGVSAIYPGVSPDIVAKEVADPIEQALKGVKGVTKVSSSSTTGSTQISVEWDYGLDNDKVLSDITSAVESAKTNLPSNDITTSVFAGSTDDIPVIQLAVASDLPLTKLGPLVEDIVVTRLSGLEGVRLVQVSGQDTTRLEVTLKGKQLDKYELTAAAVTQSVQAQLTTIPAGTSYSGDNELSVEVGTAPNSVDQVKQLPIATADDGPIRLDKLATVKITSVDRTSISRADGRPALGVGVLKNSDADSVEISHAVTDALPELERSLGNNAKFSTAFDQSPLIEQSLHDLTTEGGLGLVFAILVILVFLLSVRSTVITAISIPMSLLIALIGLWLGDYSLNLFTLAALTVAVGRVVDDSIVVIENIKRHAGHTHRLQMDSIVSSVKEVAGAVTASTLTTIAVFLPVASVSGTTGELFRPFAATVAIALGASLLVSLTIVPLLAFWFMRGKKPLGERELASGVDEADRVTPLQKGYLPVLTFGLRHPLVTLGVALMIFVGTLGASTLLKTDFLGSFGDDRALFITQTLPAGLRLDATDKAAAKVEEQLAANPDVKNYQATIGQPGQPSVVTYSLTLADAADPTTATERLRGQLTETPDAGDIVVEPGSAAYQSNDLTVSITGKDTAALRKASEEMLVAVKQVPGLTDVESNLGDQRPVLRVRIDRAEAARRGFTQAEIGQAVNAALQGTKAGTVTIADDTEDVYVRTYPSNATPKQIAALKLPISQLQQQKAAERAQDKLKDKQDDLSDRSDELSDRQEAVAEEQKRKAEEKAQEQEDDLLEARSDAREGLSDARSALAKAKRAPTPAVPVMPVNPIPTQVLAFQQQMLVYQQQLQGRAAGIAQAEAGVKQAESGVDQLDDQVEALREQKQESEEQQATQDELTDEQKAIGDDQKKLADEQEDLADVKAKAITVGDVASVKTEDAPTTVRRTDLKQAVTITATPNGSDLGTVTAALKSTVDAFPVPAGLEVDQGGASDDQATAFRQLGLAMGLAIVLVFIIMVATFKSLVQPLILLVAVPFAATGALAGLLLTGTPLGVPAMIGLLMLIGIVVTNAIVLIDLINTYRERGSDTLHAIIDGARLRLRPIIMTAAATICALLPMGFGLTGGGVFISRPLAVVVIGGLVSSTLLTLVLVPVLYGLVTRVAGKPARAQLATAPATPPAPTPGEDDRPTVIS